MSADLPEFAYSNRPVRPTGPVLSALAAVLPGVRRVQEHVEPYATWWEESNRDAVASGRPLWVAVGDSMTQGIGASAPDRGFVGQLSERLRAAGWSHGVVNLGVNGARVQDAVDRQLPQLEALRASGADVALVTVVIGSNDVVVRRHRQGLPQRFTALLDALPAGAVVSNLPNPHREARQVDALLRARDATGRVVLADMRRDGPRSWRGRLASDAFHPNDLGYAGMADVLEAAVRRSGTLDRLAG